jgi:hypothetical protein
MPTAVHAAQAAGCPARPCSCSSARSELINPIFSGHVLVLMERHSTHGTLLQMLELLMERQHLTEEQAEKALLVCSCSCCGSSSTWLQPARGLTRCRVLQGMLGDFVPEQAAAFMVLLRAKVRN